MSAFPRVAGALFVASAACAASLATGSAARAGEPDASRCVSAAERGQKERDEGRLVESRATFASCGEASCPAVVRRECLRWLDEIDRRLPSIVVSVKDPFGKDVADATVTLDGAPLPDASRGREVAVDPGQHRIAAARPSGARAEETIVVTERQKGRAVSLVVDRGDGERGTGGTAGGRRVPVFSWILGGTAVLGGVGFAYFWSRGVGRVHELRDTCAPRCTDDQVAGASRLLHAGYLSLGIGIAAAVGALVVYLVEPGAGARASVSAYRSAAPGLRF